jgi:hypothetical protein
MTPLNLWRAACCVAVLGSSAVHAGRPLTTEDAGVLEPGACEFEPAFTRIRSAGESERATVAQLACGLAGSVQLHADVLRTASGGERSTDIGLGGKWALKVGQDGAPSWTLAFGTTLSKAAAGKREARDSFANLVASGQAAAAPAWTWHANLGMLRESDAQRRLLTWGVAAERAMGGGVDLAAELYGNNRGEHWLGAGVRWSVDTWSANLGVARTITRPRAHLLTVGAKLSF